MTERKTHSNTDANQLAIYVKVSDDDKAGTRDVIKLQIFGSKRTTEKVPLSGNTFEPGKTSGFFFQLRPEGTIFDATSNKMPVDPGVPLIVKLSNDGDDALKVEHVRLKYSFPDYDPNVIEYEFPFDNAVLGEKRDFSGNGQRSEVSYLGTGTAKPHGTGIKTKIKYDSVGLLWVNGASSPVEKEFEIEEAITASAFDTAIRSNSRSESLTLSASASASFGGFGGEAGAEHGTETETSNSRESGSEVEIEKRTLKTSSHTVGANKAVFVVTDCYMDIEGTEYQMGDMKVDFVAPTDFFIDHSSEWIYESDSIETLSDEINRDDHLALLKTYTDKRD